MQFNEGLPSRFPLVFTFPDFTDEQLLSIFMGMLNSSKFTLQEDKHARIAARRYAIITVATVHKTGM